MSFNNLQPKSGPFTLAPGASMRVYVWFGQGGPGQEFGDDRGAQWIMADPVDPTKGSAFATMPSSLRVSEFTKARDYWFGYHPEDNFYELDLRRTVVRYEVTVTNVGAYTTRFSVQGGGNT